jgi:hypothetical protein
VGRSLPILALILACAFWILVAIRAPIGFGTASLQLLQLVGHAQEEFWDMAEILFIQGLQPYKAANHTADLSAPWTSSKISKYNHRTGLTMNLWRHHIHDALTFGTAPGDATQRHGTLVGIEQERSGASVAASGIRAKKKY